MVHGNAWHRGGEGRFSILRTLPTKVLITVGTGGDEEVPPNPSGSSSIIHGSRPSTSDHATHPARTENRGISISFTASDRIFVAAHVWILDSRLPGFLNK